MIEHPTIDQTIAIIRRDVDVCDGRNEDYVACTHPADDRIFGPCEWPNCGHVSSEHVDPFGCMSCGYEVLHGSKVHTEKHRFTRRVAQGLLRLGGAS